MGSKILIVENPGIDPGTSRMQSGRSNIWANPPERNTHEQLMWEITVIE